MASETKSTVVKINPSGQDGSSKPKVGLSLTKNAIAVDSKPKSTTTVTKAEVKAKATSSSSKTTMKTTTVKTREKKVYSLPGQKYGVPEEREPLRIFYQSLWKQIPSSEMAKFWMQHEEKIIAAHYILRMMEHGLLSPERAKKAHEKNQRKQKELRMGTPIKSPPPPPLPPSKRESSKKPAAGVKERRTGEVKVNKRIINERDEDDFILSPKRRKWGEKNGGAASNV